MTWKPVKNCVLIGYKRDWTVSDNYVEPYPVRGAVQTANTEGVWRHQALKIKGKWYITPTIGARVCEDITHWNYIDEPPKGKA